MRIAVFIALALFAAPIASGSAQDNVANVLAECDRSAAAPTDKNRPDGVTGVAPERIDPITAVPACEAAARVKPDDPRIMFQLGRAYSAAKDYDSAKKQYERADQLGHASATNNLAALYSSGRGIPVDDARAMQLFKKASDAGIAISTNSLGQYYQNGRGGLPKDDREAARLYKVAADQGYAPAQTNLGLFAESGRGGLPKDDREAARLYKLAADQGYAFGQNKLGIFNQYGRGGLSKNDREAARLYKLAADQGSAPAQNNLGSFFEDGRGGLPKDDREAARLYKLAADQGSAYGQNRLGIFYQGGQGGQSKDDREAARLYRLAADQGDASGQDNLGLFFESGRGGLPKDEYEAARLYKLAADQGNAYGQNKLGTFYQNGRGGLAKDDREAARLYKLAADQGYAPGQNKLGIFNQYGRGGLSKDDREAARLYRLAADKGDASAQNNLGIFFEEGRGGLTRDDREAARLYKLAADNGNASGQNNLGTFYESGRGGLTRDNREAARLYKVADEGGNTSAKASLERIGRRSPSIIAALRAAGPTTRPVESGATAPATPVAAPPSGPSQQAISAERRVALVIGNSAYRSVSELPNTPNDAKGVAATLTANGFASVRLVSDMTRDGFIGALRDFQREADTADWAVVYYAGHGMELNGTNYLVPTDAKLRDDRDVQDEAVSINRVLDAVGGARKFRLVMLDACRNNPFLQKMRRSIATRGVSRGLAAVEPTGATLVVFAAKDGETAEDGSGDHSPFTASLLKRMREPGVEINRMFRLVTGDVLKATGNSQRPFVYGSIPGEDEYFFKLK